MVGLSLKGKYGLAAVFELARHYPMPLQIKQIAEAQAIPQNYLEQLLVLLKRGRFVLSTRGNQGGYQLAKMASEIKVSDVLKCLEGPLSLFDEAKDHGCLSFFWKQAEAKIEVVFDVTLEDLIYDQQRLEKMVTYAI